MQNNYHLNDGTAIVLDTEYLGEGGEGGVYSVLSPAKLNSSVAKILFKNNRTVERRYKADYMIKNPPANTKDQTGHSFLIWPESLLFDNNEFVGFLMPKAEGITLEELSSTELGYYHAPRHNEKLGAEWQRFDRSNQESLVLRLKLCSNIAKAIYTLHSNGHYIIGDLKPQNIMVQPSGVVSILDLDSCQISDFQKVLFESKMNTPEFNPPESGISKKKQISWDLFILAIIFYRVLSGVHPFFGTCKFPYEKHTLPELKIKAGLFPYGSKRSFFEVIPEGHNIFNSFPEFVQELFVMCFDKGLQVPDNRPTTLDWINKLTSKPVITDFKSNKEIIIDSQKIIISWKSTNGRSAVLKGFGVVEVSDSFELVPNGQSFFEICVSNEFGQTTEKLSLKRFPTPVIESLMIPTPDLKQYYTMDKLNFNSFNLDFSINIDDKWVSETKEKNIMANPDIFRISKIIDDINNKLRNK